MLVNLGVLRSHSRPRTSNDNPYSEAQFKTMKYMPDFPERFGSLTDARAFCDSFFTTYNHEHRHSGSACTPQRQSTTASPARSASTARPRSTRPTPRTHTGSPAAPDHPSYPRPPGSTIPASRHNPSQLDLTTTEVLAAGWPAVCLRTMPRGTYRPRVSGFL